LQPLAVTAISIAVAEGAKPNIRKCQGLKNQSFVVALGLTGKKKI
jgi:hypothetical protein